LERTAGEKQAEDKCAEGIKEGKKHTRNEDMKEITFLSSEKGHR
jgi:hypothetical protein